MMKACLVLFCLSVSRVSRNGSVSAGLVLACSLCLSSISSVPVLSHILSPHFDIALIGKVLHSCVMAISRHTRPIVGSCSP